MKKSIGTKLFNLGFGLSVIGAMIAGGLFLATGGCTQNQRAKQFGGTAEVALPSGTKLIGATWKDDELWYLTRPKREGEQPETSTLREQSSFGVLQGKVVFKESK